MKRLSATAVSVVTAAGFMLIPVAVHADTVPPACTDGDILRSLWAGANFNLNVNEACLGTPGDSGTTGGQPGGSSRTTNYIAMGDSVAAGPGLGATAPGTDAACGVTYQAYPYLVATALGQPVTNLACSGATAGDLFTNQNASGHTVSPQLNGAFANGTPTLITITAGANDMQWVNFLRKCYAAQCGTSFDTATASALRQTVALKLNWSLSEINRMSDGAPPQVILTGYYYPISSSCSLATGNITQAEISWMSDQLNLLNQTIAQAASGYSFARYAPVSFQDHELCTSDPWVQGLNDPAPFHPTVEGQQAIANAVLAQM